VLCAALLLLIGCEGSARIRKENDRLRGEVQALEKETERLADLNAQLHGELKQARIAPRSVPEEILRNTPQVARIAIGPLSHAEDEDGDGRPDTLYVHVKPSDDLGRFVQMVGELSVHAAVLPSETDSITIGRRTLAPDEVRQAYRSSFLGSHYSVQLPVRLDEGLQISDCVVRVEFVDGHSGLRHTARRSIEL
jgi:hypothetical protein